MADTITLDTMLGNLNSVFKLKANAATTIAGYGITDAYIDEGRIVLGAYSVRPITAHANGFSTVSVGSSVVSASSAGSKITISAGSNVTVTGDSTSNKITIAATNSVYSAGTGLTLSGSTFNHTNSVAEGSNGNATATSGSTVTVPFVQWDSQGHITSAGTHVHTITGFNNYVHPTGDGNLHVLATGTSNNGKFLMAGSSEGSLSWSTPADTHFSAGLKIASESSGTSTVSATTNETTFINLVEGSETQTVKDSIQVKGTGAASVTTSNGIITISAHDTTYTSLKNPYAISITAAGSAVDSYDGSDVKTLAFTSGASDGSLLITMGSTSQTVQLKGKFTDNNTTYSAGSGLSLADDNITFNHANSVTAVTSGGVATSTSVTPGYGETFNVPHFTYDAQGHITDSGVHTVKIPASDNTDTKNTAGATDTSSKIYLIGATSQGANPQTYSDDSVYASNGSVYAMSFIAESSREVKENISPADDIIATDKIDDIDIVHYNYIDDEKKTPKIGFIAEDTETIFSTPEQKAMDIQNCIGVLLKAVQELNERLKKLEENK